jgi:putative salt-induced outer membrane protein
MREAWYGPFVVVLVLGGSGLAAGQEPAEAPPIREGSAELSFVGTSGNTSTNSLGAGCAIVYRPEEWELTAKTAYVRTRSSAVLSAEAFDTTLRAARSLTPRVSAFSRYGHLRDRFAGIAHRHGIDAGISVRVVTAERHELTVSGGAGYSSERRVVAPDVNSAVVPLGVLYEVRLSDTARVGNDLAFVASLQDAGDRRFTNVATLTARLTSQLSLKVSNTARHLSQPAPDFEPLDTVTAIALVATF